MKKVNSSLSHEIQVEFDKLIIAVQGISKELWSVRSITGTGGLVSIADLVAYQIGWGNLVLGWYQAGIAGQRVEMPGEGFLSWDYVGLAQHFYQKYRYDAAELQCQIFFNLVQDLISIVEREYLLGNLDKIQVWEWTRLPSGKEWSLSKWIRVNTVAPYKRARALIRTASKGLK